MREDYLGEVIDIDDPKKLKRIKVRVRGVYDELDEDIIPWALPRFISHNQHDLPPVGAEVSVKFMNGDIHTPTWYAGGHYTNELDLSDDDYKTAVVLFHKNLENYESSGVVSARFEESKGITIELEKDNVRVGILIGMDGTIKMEADGRFLHILKDMISLGQEDKSSEPAVLGEKNEGVLNDLNEQDKVIVDWLQQTFAKLASSATPNPYTAALGAVFTSSIPDLVANFQASYTPLKSDIPNTKSKKTSLD